MRESSWTEEDILKLSKDRDGVIKRILGTLSNQGPIVFTAKLGFGVPQIDFIAVDRYRNTTGYVLKFPVVNGKINTAPYFQGLGEAFFLPDQMLDESNLLVPEIELSDNTALTRSPDPLYRLKKATFESGISVFDRDFNVKVVSPAKGSMAKQYQRLKIELLDEILKFGGVVVGAGKEERYEEWRNWARAEVERLGDQRFMDEGSAMVVVKKILEEKNYRNIEMNLDKKEIPSSPRPIPIFEVKGSGLYLGDGKEFSLQISRISGMVLKRDY